MTAIPLLEPESGDPEQRFVMHGVPWSLYVVMRDNLDLEGSNVRMTYLEGTLELMSPSESRERAKVIIAKLLTVWSMENPVALNPTRRPSTSRASPSRRW